MIYLSRLLLEPNSRQVQRETADPYNLHRTILKAFTDNRDQSGILHRLEVHPRTGQITLLVQSQAEPDWSPLLNKDYLLPTDPFSGLDNPAIKTVNLTLAQGQIFQFRLVANPTIKKVRRDENDERRNSNRVPLKCESCQKSWLYKKAKSHGFHILDLQINQSQNQKSWQKDNGRPITLYTVQFNGRLQITNADQFNHALCYGIGPAKAFGCGLLSLAPA
ncbi:MAG: type I-E CRISPR-associated protein Cas6/Cse3/CasE [Anaerolineales bacterium]|nr:type I-E CRISPR-associated protein Cas6/Cse3/CasE [Anaerolineales bacterium]